ncbi:TPA: hypothetical protein DCZ09_00195, partial [Candidatus Nomurabacteria bacterium]|nr:hypothetical protein [Candidatus Nomurabacteria bacterium]
RTRGARGSSKLNCTLHESPTTTSLHSATPKRKNVPCFLFSRGWFFLKWKGHFSFWGSALQVFGQCGGANADSDGRAGEIRCIERSAKKANLVCKAEDWRWSSTWCRFSSIRMTDVYTGLPQSEV